MNTKEKTEAIADFIRRNPDEKDNIGYPLVWIPDGKMKSLTDEKYGKCDMLCVYAIDEKNIFCCMMSVDDEGNDDIPFMCDPTDEYIDLLYDLFCK